MFAGEECSKGAKAGDICGGRVCGRKSGSPGEEEARGGGRSSAAETMSVRWSSRRAVERSVTSTPAASGS